MIFYTADLHFGHTNVIRFDGRPFSDRDEMDAALIELWNARVRAEDTVYIVGDLCHRSERAPSWYLKQLAGHKYLVIGNHDHPVLKDDTALKLLDGVDKLMFVKDGDNRISLCHYPLAEWNKMYGGAWHIYGHIHNRKNEAYEFMRTRERALNAGCMINGYMPATFEELVKNNRIFQESD